MKIERILLQNFKRFDTLEIHLTNDLIGGVNTRLLILGDNGTGKTSVLQAVALVLSCATGKIRSISEFDWAGWLSERYERWGTPIIELDVSFSDEEIEITRKVAHIWHETCVTTEHEFILPGDRKKVTLRLEGSHYYVVSGSIENLYQFRGRKYAAGILKNHPEIRGHFSQLPGVFWYDQYRNLITRQVEDIPDTGRLTTSIGVAQLRKYLISWKLKQIFQETSGGDWLKELETRYQSIFQERSFGNLEPRYSTEPTTDEFFFTLSDGMHTYDIEEMSAGEQSVFPILFEFVRMQIAHSVVLIDEIDLNLHPPLAQALLASLPRLGPDCQFIFTTHSDAISSLMAPEEIFRLPGGKLCL